MHKCFCFSCSHDNIITNRAEKSESHLINSWLRSQMNYDQTTSDQAVSLKNTTSGSIISSDKLFMSSASPTFYTVFLRSGLIFLLIFLASVLFF